MKEGCEPRWMTLSQYHAPSHDVPPCLPLLSICRLDIPSSARQASADSSLHALIDTVSLARPLRAVKLQSAAPLSAVGKAFPVAAVHRSLEVSAFVLVHVYRHMAMIAAKGSLALSPHLEHAGGSGRGTGFAESWVHPVLRRITTKLEARQTLALPSLLSNGVRAVIRGVGAGEEAEYFADAEEEEPEPPPPAAEDD